ncbi:MAG: Wzz/FepE/Etk N-terminal domain-containing protein [Deltaproteobacteria bacterium]|nr:Wzz/FepE/Etk N-terminal domain-containing protein [Deltaproteobacteria bacterium]
MIWNCSGYDTIISTIPQFKRSMQTNLSKNDPFYTEKPPINLLDLWDIIWYSRKLVIIVTCGLMFVTAVVGFLLPNKYESTTTFVSLSQNSQSSFGELGSLASMAGFAMPDNGESSISVKVVINSRVFIEKIIDKLDLLTIIAEGDYDPKMDRDSSEFKLIMSKAVDYIAKKVINYSEDMATELQSISIVLKDPELATKMANLCTKELEIFFKENNFSKTKKSKDLIEEQFLESKAIMDQSEENLTRFSEKWGFFEIKDQSSMLAGIIGKVKGEIILEEVNYQVISQMQGSSNTQAKFSKERLEALNKQLHDLEVSTPLKSKAKQTDSITISMQNLPAVGLEFGRLQREVMINQEIYKFLRTQLETAKIDVIKNSDYIQVIDPAVVPQIRSFPKIKIMVAIAGMVGIFSSILWVFSLSYFKSLRSQ